MGVGMGLGMCATKPWKWPGQLSPCICTHCSQWPYCEKRCSYCNFNKYIPRGVEEAAMQKCLVTEAQTLLRLSGVQRWVVGAVGSILGIIWRSGRG